MGREDPRATAGRLMGLDREIAMRADNRVRNRLASAKLRFPEASIEDIDFAAPRGLDRRNTMALAPGPPPPNCP
jgi:DNA replication protein DnaC